MKSSILRRFAFAAVILGIAYGCDTLSGPGTAPPDDAGVNDFSDTSGTPSGTIGAGIIGDDTIELAGEETRSFFTAFQIDPASEDSSGPKFVVAADVDQDGLMDLVSAWNQSQPIQLHLQRRDAEDNVSFRTVTIAGTSPTGVMAGLQVGQLDGDGWLDIVVLVKASGGQTLCPPEMTDCVTDVDCNALCLTDPNCQIVVQCGNRIPGVCDNFNEPSLLTLLEGEIIVYFSPGSAALVPDGDGWEQMILINPFVADPWIHNQFPGHEEMSFEASKTQPEWSGFTSLVVADLDNDSFDDILVALNPAECKELGQRPPVNTIDLWLNPGAGQGRSSALWGAPPPDGQSRNVPISLMSSAAQVKDIEVMDVDDDGDLDVIASFTNAISRNIRWRRNPFIAHTTGGPSGRGEMVAGQSDGWRLRPSGWEADSRPIGQVDGGADILDVGDIDGDGSADLLVRSTLGRIVQWFRHPNALVIEPEFPPDDAAPTRFNFPWPVFTLTEFDDQEPQAIAVGDVTGDGQLELMVAAGGAVFWYDSTTAPTVFDPWSSNTIIQDSASDADDPTLAGPTPGAGVGVTETDTSTNINALLIVDLDGDGKNDIVGTLDRRSGSGLSDDRLVWYRNTRTDP